VVNARFDETAIRLDTNETNAMAVGRNVDQDIELEISFPFASIQAKILYKKVYEYMIFETETHGRNNFHYDQKTLFYVARIKMPLKC